MTSRRYLSQLNCRHLLNREPYFFFKKNMSTWFSPTRPSTTHNVTTTNNVPSYGLNYNSQTSQMPSLSAQVNKQQTSHSEINNKKHKSGVCSLADNLNREQFRTPSTYSNVLKSANVSASFSL